MDDRITTLTQIVYFGMRAILTALHPFHTSGFAVVASTPTKDSHPEQATFPCSKSLHIMATRCLLAFA